MYRSTGRQEYRKTGRQEDRTAVRQEGGKQEVFNVRKTPPISEMRASD